MKLGIIHLTDIHLTQKTDIDNKIISLNKVIENDLNDSKKGYLVFSGDIANTGNSKEYIKAYALIQKILDHIKNKLTDINIEVIIVPGNHDCNFDRETQIRKNSINQPDYSTLGKDNSVIDTCLHIQDDFWKFYAKYNEIPENKLFYQKTDTINEKTICFHCFNTAWMSQINEEPGTLFFPVKFINKNIENFNYDINISVLHHPINWFTPESKVNNRKELQIYLDSISDIHLTGHEHETGFEKRDDYDKNTSSLYLSGENLNKEKNPNNSGFQIITIDILSRKGILKRYKWNNNLYALEKDNDFTIEKNYYGRTFCLQEKLVEEINQIKMPLVINKDQIKLSEIFIYPDLEAFESNLTNINDYIDSKNLIGHPKIKRCVLEGNSQSGKSSLLKMLFLDYYNSGYYPILLSGKNINKPEFSKIIKKAFIKIYSDKESDYEAYKQLDKKKKIILIDDFHKTKIPQKKTQEFLNQATKNFDQIITTVDTIHGMLPQIHAEFADYSSYSIEPFGYKKTNDLIVKYHYLNENPLSIQEQVFLEKTRHSFDQVRTILGNKIMPSYPIFLLSILKSLESTAFDLNETSYGYCYQSLIHIALSNTAKVKNDDMSIYMNFIKELAYFLYKSETKNIIEPKLLEFYNDYSKQFVVHPFNKIIENLLKSQILKEEESYYEFGYKYIFYFLVAKHISDIINTDEGKTQLKELFEYLHLEDNANILVFITHHTNDISFINDSLFSAMLPFENIQPITLEKDGIYYHHIYDIAIEISNDIIEQNKIPEEERERQLIVQDKANRETKNNNSDNLDNLGNLNNQDELNEVLHPFMQAYRSIDLVGQIVKNRKGSLSKDNIIELISEVYLTGFRTISYLGNTFKDAKLELIEELKEKISEEDSKDVIKKKINAFFQMISLQACLGIFSKIIYSVGIKDLNQLYNEVADKIDTTAAKLVSFSINSYYNKISVEDIIKLSKEFKDNIVAMHILKSRVKSYIYNNHIDFRKKQQIAQALNMKILPKKKK